MGVEAMVDWWNEERGRGWQGAENDGWAWVGLVGLRVSPGRAPGGVSTYPDVNPSRLPSGDGRLSFICLGKLLGSKEGADLI